MCSVMNGGRLPTSATGKARNNHLDEMSEAESNPESPKPSPPKSDDGKNDADEELSVGSPGTEKKLGLKTFSKKVSILANAEKGLPSR